MRIVDSAGRFAVFAGPTASGKSTILRRLMAEYGAEPLGSYTTRRSRGAGDDQRCISESEFAQLQEKGFFCWAETVLGCRYGTSYEDVEWGFHHPGLYVAPLTLAGGVLPLYSHASAKGFGERIFAFYLMTDRWDVLQERMLARPGWTQEQAVDDIETGKRWNRIAACFNSPRLRIIDATRGVDDVYESVLFELNTVRHPALV